MKREINKYYVGGTYIDDVVDFLHDTPLLHQILFPLSQENAEFSLNGTYSL